MGRQVVRGLAVVAGYVLMTIVLRLLAVLAAFYDSGETAA
jgi:hypothetical protein